MDAIPIPAFYCCYLLRSTTRHQSLYVGSTPNMLRRLQQHNGKKPGGAKRTDWERLRPWEVVCYVHGFPSKISALQFEWSWQNTHVTRHIDKDDRITKLQTTTRTSRKTGRKITKILSPPMNMQDKLENLHLLLRSKSFRRWPLALRFFSPNVHAKWEKYDESLNHSIRSNIDASLDPHVSQLKENGTVEERRERELQSFASFAPNAIELQDFTYQSVKVYLEKSLGSFSSNASSKCAVCNDHLHSNTSLTLMCPHEHCDGTSHLQCLSSYFLKQDMALGSDESQVLPLAGRCPLCRRPSSWGTMVQELSLRVRGRTEVDKLFRKDRRKRGDRANDARIITEGVETKDTDDISEHEDDSEDERRFKEFEAEEIRSAIQESSNGAVEETAVQGNRTLVPRSRRASSSVDLQRDEWCNAEIVE